MTYVNINESSYYIYTHIFFFLLRNVDILDILAFRYICVHDRLSLMQGIWGTDFITKDMIRIL